MLDALVGGLNQALSVNSLLGLLLGTTVGYIFGFIPGLQSVTALVLMLPFTFGWDPITGMYVFAGIIGAAGNGGAVTSIALNMPGTVVNVATSLDGYPLARQGKASWALGVASCTSLLGAAFGLVVLVAVIPLFMPFLMAFGPAERFWIMVLGMVSMVVALPGDFIKSTIAVALGIVMATVGFGGPSMVYPRFTFGSIYLLNGLDLVAVVIGFLVLSEAFVNLAKYRRAMVMNTPRHAPLLVGTALERWKDGLAGMRVPFRYPGVVLRGSAIGTLIGAIPGVGGSVAQFFAYNAAYAVSKRPEEFGHGSVEGLIAAQAAVDAKEAGTCLPTFAFGIPGNSEMALVLAAWELHGLQPGIYFLRDHADVAWALILGLFGANILATLLQVLCLPVVSYIPHIREDYVAAAVLVFSILAAYSIRQNLWDVGLIVFCGVLGALFKGYGYSIIGIVVGFILGDLMEANFHTSLQSSLGSYSIFVSSPVSVFLIAGTALILLLSLMRWIRRSRVPANRA